MMEVFLPSGDVVFAHVILTLSSCYHGSLPYLTMEVSWGSVFVLLEAARLHSRVYVVLGGCLELFVN